MTLTNPSISSFFISFVCLRISRSNCTLSLFVLFFFFLFNIEVLDFCEPWRVAGNYKKCVRIVLRLVLCLLDIAIFATSTFGHLVTEQCTKFADENCTMHTEEQKKRSKNDYSAEIDSGTKNHREQNSSISVVWLTVNERHGTHTHEMMWCCVERSNR